MNATESYNQLIRFRIANPLPNDVYGERHHIVPKSCGGNDYENIIRLTPEEHYRAHALLAEIYSSGLEHRSMVFAWRVMTSMTKGEHITEEEYARLKIKYSKAVSSTAKERGEHYHNKMSAALKGHTVSEETRRKISEKLKGKPSNRKGAHLSEESRRKVSDSLKKYHRRKAS